MESLRRSTGVLCGRVVLDYDRVDRKRQAKEDAGDEGRSREKAGDNREQRGDTCPKECKGVQGAQTAKRRKHLTSQRQGSSDGRLQRG